MNNLFLISVVLLIFSSPSSAGDIKESPYAGEEMREIKVLSTEDIDGYLKGEGMGFAKAAELNHYPGPRHVLDMAGELNLSIEQRTAIEEIYKGMHTEAVSLGKKVIEEERRLDTLFAGREIDEGILHKLVMEIGRLFGELRIAHLKAHLKTASVLTSEQIDRYDDLRGYSGTKGKPSHEHHRSHRH